MTSTEFTAGIGEGARVSSKVLKPPGGGSSDIFGVEGAGAGSAKSSDEKSLIDASTHSRVFGTAELPRPPTKSMPLHQSSIFGNGNQAPKQNEFRKLKKAYVRRNPITGEEIEISLKAENDKNVCDIKEPKEDEKEDNGEEHSKPMQTSTNIRVRNPPGGKSSGIF